MGSLDEHRGGRDRARHRVALATMIGTTFEWYDYFIYASAVALVLRDAFFTPVGGASGTILALSTVGVSFLFRPLGAVVMGRWGDRYGRRFVLLVTLGLMAVGTTLIGLLPTYASAGAVAPVLLVLLRIVQGFAVGGEWAAAALMAVEHAEPHRRGRAGAFPQLGVPLGMLLATGVNAVLLATLSADQYDAWGWRVPFMFSVVLLAVGYYIRRHVAETPVFDAIRATSCRERAPLRRLITREPRRMARAILVPIGNSAAGYMLTGGYFLVYGTDDLGLDREVLLVFIAVGSVAWLGTTWIAGGLSDRIGRPRTVALGYAALLVWMFPTFLLLDSARLGLVLAALMVFGLVLGLSYGPLPALYAEEFPAPIRLSGASISSGVSSILGGAFAPTIAAWLDAELGTSLAVAGYLAAAVLVSLIAALTFADRRGVDLGPAAPSLTTGDRPDEPVARG